jgi:DNA-directed RNA polymerase subunit alpha
MSVLETGLEQLEIGARVYHCLRNCGCRTVGDILEYGEGDLLRQPNFGRKSLIELREVLACLGLNLQPGYPKFAPHLTGRRPWRAEAWPT